MTEKFYADWYRRGAQDARRVHQECDQASLCRVQPGGTERTDALAARGLCEAAGHTDSGAAWGDGWDDAVAHAHGGARQKTIDRLHRYA